MPWLRIDENALEHPKIGGLSDGAFRLWVQGLAYCQKFLTDGFITDISVRGLRSYSPKRKGDLVTAGLWDSEAGGILVHDYLDWNESRDHVMACRQFAKDRMKRNREKRSNDVRANSERSSPIVPNGVGVRGVEEVKERGPGKTTAERAGEFVQWYEDTHQRLFGIGYMGVNRDWEKALELAAKFSDQQMRDAALVWFGHDDDFALSGTRTIVKFASRVTGCLQQAKARGIA